MAASDLTVMVIGGGIGGLCLAQGLRRTGVGVDVYERDQSQTARLDRYRLHINPSGTRSLHACLSPRGWADFLASAGKPGGGFGFLDDQLRSELVVEDRIMYPATTDPAEKCYPVDRRSLRRSLMDGLADVVHFGKTFERYEHRSDGQVTAYFTDGTSATADVLIGADGANSRVRRQRFPDYHRIDTGAVGVGLKLPLTEETRAWLPSRLQTGENMVLPQAPYFLFTSVFERNRTPGPDDEGNDDYLLCAFVAQREALPVEVSQLDGAALRRTVASMVSQWHPDLRRLIESCDPDSVGCYPFLAAAPPEPGATTNVVLMGDAVHSMPPTGGLGANTALRDARLLTRQLAGVAHREQPLLPALAAYEADMRDYGSAAVRSSLTMLRQGLTSNALAVAGMRAWFRLSATVPAVRRLGFRDTWAKDARPRAWEQSAPTNGMSLSPTNR